jgi:hypothetical protein
VEKSSLFETSLRQKPAKQSLSLCHKNLTEASRRFRYDADYIAGSPQWFEKYPQDSPFSEQAPCENEFRLNGHFEQGALFTQSKHMK